MILPGISRRGDRCRLRWRLALLLLTLSTAAASPTFGQNLPVLDYTGRPGEQRPELLDQRPESATPAVELPPLATPPESRPGAGVKSVFVRQVVVSGSSVFPAEELAKVTAAYENRFLSMEELETLRRDLTLLYVAKGYVNSGALIPDQTVADGIVTMQIVEGRLADIRIEESGRFADAFLEERIRPGAGVPLNVLPLQERLQQLQQDPRIRRVQAELRPGARPGGADLEVRVEEKPPMSLWLAFNNYLSPTLGEEQGIATFEHRNLTGHGDILSLTYGTAEGLDQMIDAWYAIPVNARDTTLQLRYRRSEQAVVDDLFGPLDIVSEEESFELALRHPLYRSLTQEVALSLSIGKVTNENSLLGDKFSFTPGEENGRSRVIPLRFGQDWTYRTRQQVVAARSRFTFGLDALGATVHRDDDIPDGKFVAWLGQLQYARILDTWHLQLLARADLQLSSDPLLPVEKFGIGGRYSVRGYRENQLVADEAFAASLEARLPLVENLGWADYLQLCPFIDFGKGHNVDQPTPSPDEIASIGLGMRWGTTLLKGPVELRAEAELYWGYPLREVEDRNEGRQDDGIHYQVAITGYF